MQRSTNRKVLGESLFNEITIRDIDEAMMRRLRIRAATNGRSVEDEVRHILRAALPTDAPPTRNLGTAIHELFEPLGGVDLDIPPREPMRQPPQFD